MRFSKRDQTYQVSRITGPTHNLLRLELHPEEENTEPALEALQLDPPEPDSGLDPNIILNEVLTGIATANSEFGVSYTVRRIQYVPSDTPSKGVYEFMAKSIVERIVEGGEFLPLK